ncbi:anthranilate phosphoribosyltransferase [bacterium]|nr:anthranilate phosphoribosyltransferase [bacterium]
MDIKEAIHVAITSKNLKQAEAYHIADEIMSGHATDAQIAALLVALRSKGETIDEITGFAKAMREKATSIHCHADCVVDTCGTGGDRAGTFNISTLSAFVAAGAGCQVAKHGNRSVSSRCGSADLLKELGINIEIAPEAIVRCIDEVGIGFLFAPLLHKAMKYAIGPRREIGIRTIFNILGPLTNPAGARRQLLGVFDGDLTEPLAHVLMKLGSEHVLVVHGEDGLDEISLTKKTKVSELRQGEIRNYFLEPEQFHFSRIQPEEIRGGDPAENARIGLDVLKGVRGAPSNMVLLNAGAAIYVSGLAQSIEEGIERSRESIDSGKALEKLEALKKMTNH